jgi:sugar (pentulose or hexulose) kinase
MVAARPALPPEREQGMPLSEDVTILATAVRTHEVARPARVRVEMGAEEWWEEFSSIAKDLTDGTDADIRAVGVSGMGPCVLVTDDGGTSLRPAIPYGHPRQSRDRGAKPTNRCSRGDPGIQRIDTLSPPRLSARNWRGSSNQPHVQ